MSNNIIYKIYETKYKTLPLAVKAVIWFTACNFLIRGLSFISAPVFTRLLPEEEYGLLAIILSYETLLMTFATWDIHTGAYQRGYFRFKNDISFFTISTITLINIITLVVFIFLFIFYDKVKYHVGISLENLVLLLLYALTFPAYQMWIIRKRSEFAYKSVVVLSLAYAIVGLTVSIITILILKPTANIKFGAGLTCAIGFCLFFYYPSISFKSIINRFEDAKKQWCYCVKYQGPLLLHSLSFIVLSQADRVMIGEMVGKTQTAYYSVAYNLAMAIIILQNSMEQSLQPWRFIKMEEKSYKQIGDSTNLLLIFVGTAILMFVLVAPEFMKLLFTDNYYESVWSIPPIAASVYFICLYNIFVNVETYFEKTIYVMLITIVCCLFNVGLNFVCIRLYGYISCGYTTLISYIMFGILHYIIMKIICNKEISGTIIFSGIKILIISVLFTVSCVGITLLYDYPIIRYVLLVGISMIVYVQRERVTPILSLLRRNNDSI